MPMKLARTLMLNEIIDAFEKTYLAYLVEERLKDTGVVRAGYYSTVEELIRTSPFPDIDLQHELLTYITSSRIDEANDNIDRVKSLFNKTLQTMTV